jgi:hypothetical protein
MDVATLTSCVKGKRRCLAKPASGSVNRSRVEVTIAASAYAPPAPIRSGTGAMQSLHFNIVLINISRLRRLSTLSCVR